MIFIQLLRTIYLVVFSDNCIIVDFWERFRDANSVSKSKLQSFEPFEKVTFNINNNVASVKAVTHTYFVKYDASVDKINQ